MKEIFGIIGGDKRQLYLAKSIQNDGYTVYICGFELSCDTENLEELCLKDIIAKSNNIILPLPCTRDGRTIFSPYSEKELVLDEYLENALEDKNVYGGFMRSLTENNPLWKNINYQDYYQKEELAISNAIPTAEGAISLAINNHDGILCGSNCLVAGFGRIGKILTKNLLGLGVKVDVSARKNEDLAMISAIGANPVKYNEITKSYDLIFNTVPELVITKKILEKQNSDTVIIELATLPGGIDRKIALLLGIKIVDAQSLPGKVSPKAVANFTKNTIYNIIGLKT